MEGIISMIAHAIHKRSKEVIEERSARYENRAQAFALSRDVLSLATNLEDQAKQLRRELNYG